MTSLDHLVIRVYSTLARIYIVFHTQEHGDNVKVLKMGQALDGTSSQRDGHRPTEVEFGQPGAFLAGRWEVDSKLGVVEHFQSKCVS